MPGTGLRSVFTSTFVLMMLFQEDKADRRPEPEWVRASRAGLASHRGSETGGHSHGTRTHQQVLVMGAILGSRGEGGDRKGGMGGEIEGGAGTQASRDEWEKPRKEREHREGQRETAIREVTVNTHARHYHHTINTVRQKHRRGARGRAKTKTQERQGGEGVSRVERDRRERTTVTGFPLWHPLQGPFNEFEGAQLNSNTLDFSLVFTKELVK